MGSFQLLSSSQFYDPPPPTHSVMPLFLPMLVFQGSRPTALRSCFCLNPANFTLQRSHNLLRRMCFNRLIKIDRRIFSCGMVAMNRHAVS
jgi:hypothetical protein